MIKPYNELRKIDVLKYCEIRKAKDENGRQVEIPYLNWAKCIDLLHENGAEKAYFVPLYNEKGSSLFMSDSVFTDKYGTTNRCYEVRIKIVIDDQEYEMTSPVMNGSNPVKDNSMSQQRVWNAQTRAFVKGVAIYTGLGFDLWVKSEDDVLPSEDDLSIHDIRAIQKRVEMLITAKMQSSGRSQTEIARAIGLSDRQLKGLMDSYGKLFQFERALQRI